VPGDGHIIDQTKDAASHILSQLLVDLRKKKIVAYADAQTALSCNSRQRLAVRGLIAHGFFKENIYAGFEQRARRLKMLVWR
jgi:hypothetical protein